MTNPFLHLTKPEEVKKEFRRLCFLHHPDHGGKAEDFRALNSQYLERLRVLDGSKHTANGKEFTYTYNDKREKEVAEKLAAAIGALPASVDIVLIGIYIWIGGDTKPEKETLKKLGFYWSKNRARWYWKPADYKSRRSKAGLDMIAARYGYSKFSGGKEEEKTPRRESLNA
jgi:curved DNA-binding protein CbpA